MPKSKQVETDTILLCCCDWGFPYLLGTHFQWEVGKELKISGTLRWGNRIRSQWNDFAVHLKAKPPTLLVTNLQIRISNSRILVLCGIQKKTVAVPDLCKFLAANKQDAISMEQQPNNSAHCISLKPQTIELKSRSTIHNRKRTACVRLSNGSGCEWKDSSLPECGALIVGGESGLVDLNLLAK